MSKSDIENYKKLGKSFYPFTLITEKENYDFSELAHELKIFTKVSFLITHLSRPMHCLDWE